VRRALALAAALLLASCTAPSPDRAPEPGATRAATAALEDALILASLKARLTAEYPDSATSVRVSVRDRVVTLRGSVRDGATRKRMVEDAQMTVHVNRVVDQLHVDPHQRRLADQLGDVALAARVQTAFTAQVGPQNVQVRVDRGIATVSGTVHDAKTKSTILATARGTSGVRNVVDRIRVTGP
jgi:osmotically-inducible protein OsmY